MSGQSEDEAEIDQKAYGVYQALPLNGSDPDGPTEAELYLQSVRAEANALPSVVTSAINPRQYAAKQSRISDTLQHASVTECAPHWFPNAAWAERFLERFDALSEQLNSDVAEASDQLAAQLDAVNLEDTNGTTDSGAGEEWPNHLPSTAAVQKLDQVQALSQIRARLSVLQLGHELNEPDAMWLFALLARLEGPLAGDDTAMLHSLFKSLVDLRAHAEEGAQEHIPHLTMLLFIVGGRFGQDPHLAPMYGRY